MELPEKIDLPFFAYGTFKPGQLGFYRLLDCVEEIEPVCTIRGDLLERDGLPIVDESGRSNVEGSLIKFRPDSISRAYLRIIEIEPDKHYRWGVANVSVRDTTIEANVLYGRTPRKGSIPLEDVDWDGRKDALFTFAIEVIRETLEQNSEFEWNLKPLFRLQMAYLLLWSAIERYVSLRYHLGDKVMEKIYHIAEEEAFISSLKEIVTERRSVFRADRPDKKVTLDPLDPRKSIDYYYQVRSNITHRGKAVVNDFYIVKSSLAELHEIFIRVLAAAFQTENIETR